MINIDQNLCKTCGICGEVCPRHIPITMNCKKNKITTVVKEKYLN